MIRSTVENTQTCHSAVTQSGSRCLLEPGSTGKISQICDSAIVDKAHLASICIHLCDQLRFIIDLLLDFAGDVSNESASTRSLLRELKDKVLPFLINLDIEMAASEKLIRINIDTARISETKVDWLLRFNKCKLEMREMLTALSGTVYEDLERVLSLRCRGCFGVTFKEELMLHLHQMKSSTNKLQQQIKLEQCCLIK